MVDKSVTGFSGISKAFRQLVRKSAIKSPQNLLFSMTSTFREISSSWLIRFVKQELEEGTVPSDIITSMKEQQSVFNELMSKI